MDIGITRAGTGLARNLAAYEWWMRKHRQHGSAGRAGVEDISIYYRRYGFGEPVLMLHGGFFFAESWAGQIPALAARHLVITPDSRGHGRTTLGDKGMHYRVMAGDVAGLIEALGIGPVDLVGWSDGGTAALYLALERPDLIRRMVLLGTPFNVDNYSPEAQEEIEDLLRPSPMLAGLLAMRWAMAPAPRRTREFLEQMRGMWMDEPLLDAEQLGRILVPTLVIGCDKDEFLSLWGDPYHVFRSLADALPNGRMAPIPGGTHTVSIERSEVVNKLMTSFFDS